MMEGLQAATTRSRKAFLEEICLAYREPLIGYLRHLGAALQDCEDRAHEVLTKFVHSGGFLKASPQRGSLRAFLKSAAANHMKDHWRAAQAQKRGGGEPPLPLLEDADLICDGLQPDEAFDREWAMTMFERALERLRRDHFRSHPERFEILKARMLQSPAALSSAAIAAKFSAKESSVRGWLARMRQHFALCLREEVLSTVRDPEEAKAELAYLLQLFQRASV